MVGEHGQLKRLAARDERIVEGADGGRVLLHLRPQHVVPPHVVVLQGVERGGIDECAVHFTLAERLRRNAEVLVLRKPPVRDEISLALRPPDVGEVLDRGKSPGDEEVRLLAVVKLRQAFDRYPVELEVPCEAVEPLDELGELVADASRRYGRRSGRRPYRSTCFQPSASTNTNTFTIGGSPCLEGLVCLGPMRAPLRRQPLRALPCRRRLLGDRRWRRPRPGV